MDDEGNIKLANFAAATEFKENEKLNTFPGTIEYLAPEVIAGKKYDGRKSDVWSLGITLYGMVTGQFPFNKNGKYL